MTTTTPLAIPTRRSGERRRPTRVGKTYFIQTFGCQMNEHDSERIAGLFEADGMTAAEDYRNADVIFINTCTIRENADNRLYGHLGYLKRIKESRPGTALLVGGCAAQKDRDLVRQRAPWVDVVIGTHNLGQVVSLLDHAQEWGPITEIVEELQDVPSVMPAHRQTDYSAWVSIQIGCNNTCTFCIVPAVRGPEVSRRPGDVVREVESLAQRGVVEVTLLGQNVNTYGRDLALHGRRRPIFAELLRRVGAVDGIRRIRFTSPHPADFREEVAAAMAETPAVCEQLHLPLQSGSDRILARMHRGYNARRFRHKLDLARDFIPGLSVTTDIIVGFPGETERDFQATLDLVEEVRFDSAFTFIFSPRPGTAAAEMSDQFVASELAHERLDRLIEAQGRISLDRNLARVGARTSVLFEGPSKKDPAVATGRSRGGQVVHVEGHHQAGTFAVVEIEAAATHYLSGSVV